MKFYTQEEVRLRIGLSPGALAYWKKQGLMPEVPKAANGRYLYTHEHIKMIRKIMRERGRWKQVEGKKYYSIAAAADVLKVGYNSLRLRILRGSALAPGHVFSLRKMYAEADLAILKEQVKTKIDNHKYHKDALAKGLYSISQAARYLNMPLISLRSLLDRGKLSCRPTHHYKGVPRWTREELEEIRCGCLAKYFAERKIKPTQTGC